MRKISAITRHFGKLLNQCYPRKSNERITLIENDEIIKTEKGTAKVLNAFFSNIVQNLDIQQYNVDDPICENMTHF